MISGGSRTLSSGWFVVVALGWTWSFGFTAAAVGGVVGQALHLLALLGPLLAWSVVVSSQPRPRRQAFLRRVVDVRLVPPKWWAGVVTVGVGLPVLAAATSAVAGAQVELALTGVSLLGVAGFALAAGVAEEPGWRGLAQDWLESRAGRWRSALALGVLWSLWHLPLYFIDGTYQHGLGVNTWEFWLSMLIRVPLAVLLVLLVTGARGAVVAAVAAHALGNMTGELLATGSAAMTCELVLTTAAAAVVVLRRSSS